MNQNGGELPIGICGPYFDALHILQDDGIIDKHTVIDEIRKINLGGTRSIKFQILSRCLQEDLSNVFFIKSGEKVEEENMGYDLVSDHELFIRRYRSNDNLYGTLVTDFFEGERVDVLGAKNFDINKFIEQYYDVVKDTAEKEKKCSYEKRLHEYIDGKVQGIDSSKKVIVYGDCEIPLSNLLDRDIVVNGEYCGSVRKILNKVLKMLKFLSPKYAYQLHGDLQPSNILHNTYTKETKIVDLSNMIRKDEPWRGDLAWDIGKLLAHFNGLTDLTQIRDGLKESDGSRLNIDLGDDSFEVAYESSDSISIEYPKIRKDKHFKERVGLYGLLACLITIERTSGSQKTDWLLLQALIKNTFESYRTISDIKLSEEDMTDIKFLQASRDEILQKYFSSNQITDVNIINSLRNRTSKSIFGGVEINGKLYFYKIAPKEFIEKELERMDKLQGYNPEKIIDYMYLGDTGIFIQDFNKDMLHVDGILHAYYNINLYNKANFEEILMRTDEIHRKIFERYSLSIDHKMKQGPNDKFFIERLGDGERIDQWYRNASFNLGGNIILFEELQDYIIESHGSNVKLRDIISQAKHFLSDNQNRYFVESPGDLTEQNITKNGSFFDFETGGSNSLAQEIAIYLVFCCFSGPYLLPQYGYEEYSNEHTEKFSEGIDVVTHMDHNERKMKIDLNYPLPSIKKDIAMRYIENVLNPLFLSIPENHKSKLLEQIKSAFFMRIFGITKIHQLKPKDQSIVFGILVKFMIENKGTDTINRLKEIIKGL